jgi:hypothetical protein
LAAFSKYFPNQDPRKQFPSLPIKTQRSLSKLQTKGKNFLDLRVCIC